MSEHNPIKAQEQLEKATDFVHDVGLPTGLGYANLKEVDNHEIRRAANVDRRDGLTIHYRSEEGDGGKWAESQVDVRASSGVYRADIERIDGDEAEPLFAEASVKRNGAQHNFKPENSEKAAALITSLAAKRLGGLASEHADSVVEKMTAARKAYHSKEN